MSVSVRALPGLKFIIFSSTTSTIQLRSRPRASISSPIPTRKMRSTMSRRAKAKVKNQKALKKEKDHKGPQAIRNLKRGTQKEKGRPSQKEKVNGPLGHGIRIRIRIRIGIEPRRPKRQKRPKWERQGLLSGMRQIRLEQSATGISYSAIFSEHKASLQYISEHPQDQPIQALQPDQFRGFQDLQLASQQLQQQSQSQASTHYGSASSALSHSGQVGGFSGHRLNTNHFAQPINSDRGQRNLCFTSLPHWSQSPSPSSGALGSTHRYRSSRFNRAFIVCASCTSHSYRSACQCERWRDQDQRSEDDHVRHSQNCHEHHVPHCRRCRESHHWS